jgi:hypothetical protein
MTTYVLRNGRLVEKQYAGTPSADKRPYVISDVMTPLRHPITQQLMDSKSEFRKITKAHGCIEVGNDKWPERKPVETSPVRPDIMRAFEQLRNR